MPAFYEIHDSILERLEWDGSVLELTLRAISTLSDNDSPLACGRQPIVLRIENATLTGDKVEPEIWLLDGDFVCESQISLEQDQGNGVIAASLERAEGIHLHLFGENEDTHEFPTFDIHGESLTLRKLDVVGWSKKYIPVVQSARAKVLGIGVFDC